MRSTAVCVSWYDNFIMKLHFNLDIRHGGPRLSHRFKFTAKVRVRVRVHVMEAVLLLTASCQSDYTKAVGALV